MKIYTFDQTAIIGLANEVRERVISHLEKQGILDPEKQFALRYAFVLSSRGYLGKLLDRFWKLDNDELRIMIVEVNKEHELHANNLVEGD